MIQPNTEETLEQEDTSPPYGIELILDLKGCQSMDLSRDRLERFVIDLCDLIEMRRHGDPIFWEDDSGIPHLHGLSIVQFIETSTIVCHPLPMLRAVYLNIFSCKAFDASDASRFCREFWSAQAVKETLVIRT